VNGHIRRREVTQRHPRQRTQQTVRTMEPPSRTHRIVESSPGVSSARITAAMAPFDSAHASTVRAQTYARAVRTDPIQTGQ
jgi:hypothetical protein